MEANAKLTLTISRLQVELAQSRLTEEALKHADRSKDEFLAMVAHELLNPLAPLRNAIEIMARTPLEAPLFIWSRDMIARQVVHMTRLVNDLVDVSRARVSKIELQKEALALSTIVEASVEMSRPAINARRHSLVVQLPDYPVVIDGDSIRLTQVVSNLLNNAAKYTPEGGTIWVSLEASGMLGDPHKNAVIRVRDSGMGIPLEMLSKVFEPFVRSRSALEREPSGLGLGLAVARKLIELHEGSVSARSDGEGKGTEFVVILPLLAPEP
jgi:signal transduction histidine kinase